MRKVDRWPSEAQNLKNNGGEGMVWGLDPKNHPREEYPGILKEGKWHEQADAGLWLLLGIIWPIVF